ncbi:MAG: ATP-binding protein [Desulfurivibrionaceae bacterium]
MHPLLKRQISKLIGGDVNPPGFENFFQAVSDAYTQADDDRQLIERSLEQMSIELTERNRQMRHELEERRIIEQELLREKAEQQVLIHRLEEAQNQLLQSEKLASIGQLAAGVAHEINNPMGFILSNLNTMGKYSDRLFEYQKAQEAALAELAGQSEPAWMKAEEVKALAKSLKIKTVSDDLFNLLTESIEGGERIKTIVLNLKSFARLDEEEVKEADINQCLESTLNIVWNELKYKCTVEKEYGNIPPIHCNPGRLNQVFMNLLVNAGQAIETKGEIRIATSSHDGFIEVRIEDTGCGIPKEKLSRIFEPFFTTKPVGKGTGLGLSIVYGIIEKHAGHIYCDSELGKGTCFRVVLPIDNELMSN